MLTQYQVIAFIGLLFNSLNILWQDVAQYILSVSGRELNWTAYKVWIRLSTGRFSIDLTPPESSDDGLDLVGAGALSATSVLDPPEDSQIIASISLEAYHHVCYRHPKQWHLFPIFQDTSVKVGSIRHFPAPEYENSFEIAFTPDCVVGHRGWLTEDSTTIEDRWNPIDVNEGTSILENGVNSANVVDEYRRYIYADDFCVSAWLAHANYILNLLGIKSNFEDYLVVFRIDFWVKLLGPIVTLPPGYLFICPWAQLETELPGCFGIPDCPAYWSLNLSGAERLSAKEAKNEGFPDIEFRMSAFGGSWDDSAFTGIRQFHEAKGFDPYSQDVAIALEYPLFEVSCNQDDLLTHLEEGYMADGYSDSDGVPGRNDSSESEDERHEFSDGAFRVSGEDCSESGEQQYESESQVTIVDSSADAVVGDVQDAETESEFWSIVMSVQFALILILSGLSLRDYFYSC
ncbi:hypothetical protein B0H14DRAFT_3878121 [Mycena olivaceomarginata]|nr:hypothetical protein B0H14DRAFT_3878121 [Mycena olivaceomarginata]